MLKKFNKETIKFDLKKKNFFTSSKRKPTSKMNCYNYDKFGHLDHQYLKPKKNKYKDKKDDWSDDDKKNDNKKDGKKKKLQ